MKLLFLKCTWLALAALWCTLPLSAQTPFPKKGQVFGDQQVPRVYIELPPDSLAHMLAPGNEQSNYHWHATFVFDNGEVRDTVEQIGFRLRGNTSRNSQKKSFKVSFNTYDKGRKYRGLEKLNLNGEHNDPTIMRSKLSWEMLRWLEVPAPRANHVELYINNRYYGLYMNVEHIDEVFVNRRFGNQEGKLYKCHWPADLLYQGDDPNLYKATPFGHRTYELQNNTAEDDYSDLAHFIAVLNNTPTETLPCELEPIFNVDTYLRAMVYDIFAANWDGPIYNKNNFYLYHNTATGQFEYIPFDLDNTFGIDWFIDGLASRDIYNWAHPSEPRPIYERILAVPAYRKRFSFYFGQFLDQYAQPTPLFAYIDSLRQMITPSAAADSFRVLDYGFSLEDFQTAFEAPLPAVQHVRYGLKPYLQQRISSAAQQLQLQPIDPVIRPLSLRFPDTAGQVHFTAYILDDGPLEQVEVGFRFATAADPVFQPLADDGLHGDGAAGDGIYGGSIAPPPGATRMEYLLRATDTGGGQSQWPVCGIKALSLRQDIPLYINEFMASNDSTIADEAGEYDDWVELYNGGTAAIGLKGKYLTDDPTLPGRWAFPDTSILPGQFLLVWTDNDPEQGPLHTNFRLERNGEFVGIYDSTETGFVLIDGIHFGPQPTDTTTGRLPNGTGDFQLLQPTPGASNEALVSRSPQLSAAYSLHIFPNPFADQLHIGWEKAPDKVWEVEVRDLFGKKLFARQLPAASGLLVWQAPAQAPGLYLLMVYEHGKLLHTQKVLLQP